MAEILKVENLDAWYGESKVLHGVSFSLSEGEVVTLLGRNGAGKSTTLKSIMGLLSTRKGSVLYCGEHSSTRSPSRSPVRASPIARRSAASSPASACART